MKTCSLCGESKESDQFYAYRKSEPERRMTYCKSCNSKKSVAWGKAHPDTIRLHDSRFRSKNRAKIAEYHRRRYLANPEPVKQRAKGWIARNRDRKRMMNRASEAIRHDIRAGLLIRPDTCAHCGRNDRKIEAAHHDYSQPRLVTWLCRSCHCRWDHADPKTIAKGKVQS